MALFTVELSDEDRAALECWRIKLGCRSHAEAVRRLIHSKSLPPDRVEQVVDSRQARVKIIPPVGIADIRVGDPIVPLQERKPFNPQPKKGKK